MEICFFIAAFIAVYSTVSVIIGTNPVHALLYLVVSLLAVAMIFFTLGAPFAGILEVIVYAGAIMVLFVFVIMMLNLGQADVEQEKAWLAPRVWIGPSILSILLLIELLRVLAPAGFHDAGLRVVGAREVGAALYGPYLLAVELASMLLLAALVAAYHLGKHE
ncbi:MAG: NADH-quinone oxidoreductase subunit J [Stenotrophobium sp.]